LDHEEPHGTHNTLSKTDPFQHKEEEERRRKKKQEAKKKLEGRKEGGVEEGKLFWVGSFHFFVLFLFYLTFPKIQSKLNSDSI